MPLLVRNMKKCRPSSEHFTTGVSLDNTDFISECDIHHLLRRDKPRVFVMQHWFLFFFCQAAQKKKWTPCFGNRSPDFVSPCIGANDRPGTGMAFLQVVVVYVAPALFRFPHCSI